MKRNVLRRVLAAVFALVVLVSGAVVARDLLRARRERAAYAGLASQVRQLAEREEPASQVDFFVPAGGGPQPVGGLPGPGGGKTPT